MRSLFLICLLLAVYGMTVSVVREYFYVSQQMEWTTAQNYCRENYWDLATITTEAENQNAIMFLKRESVYWAWLGLNRTAPHEQIWQWSGREKVNYTSWYPGDPNDQSPGESCAVISTGGWYDVGCNTWNHPICYRSFSLVKESKTWEEALQYCRSDYTGLAVVDSETLLDLLQTETEQTQTASVWTGLRFLSGKWVWVNGTLPKSLVSLPSCPVEPYRCAAYNFNTHVWENRDCSEELNFLCYK